MRQLFSSKKSIIKVLAVLPVFVAAVFVFNSVFAATTWHDRSGLTGTLAWSDITMSTNGGTIVATDRSSSSSTMYMSTDGLVSDWHAITNNGASFQKQWNHVACSSDCSHILASEITSGTPGTSGDLWYSSDSGTTWTDISVAKSVGVGAWTGVVMSADGSRMGAISDGGGQQSFWRSIDSGVTWTNPTTTSWTNSVLLHPHAVSMSNDGLKLAVAMFGGDGVDYIYLSNDSGNTWFAQTNSLSGFYTGVAVSGDGTKVAGALNFGPGIYISIPSSFASTSNTWTNVTTSTLPTGGCNWTTISLSNDGSKAAVGSGCGAVSIATLPTDSTWVSAFNTSGSWTAQTNPPLSGTQPGTGGWLDVAYSPDGTYLAAGGTTLGLYTYYDTAPITSPYLTTSAAASVGASVATLNGTLIATGNASITSRGFEYGTTTSYGTQVVASGTSLGAYSYSLTGLTCGGTTYHYRAIASNSSLSGHAFDDKTFTTTTCPTPPTVTTGGFSNVTSATATLGGNITALGGENASSRFIEYGTTSGVYTNQTPADTGSFSTGVFTEVARGLKAGTTYFYKACAVNGGGTGCAGTESSFTTLATPGAPTSLSGTAGYSQVSLSWAAPASSGDYAITDYLIEYKPTAGSTYYVWPHTAATTTSTIITSLANGTGYTFRVAAVSAAGQGSYSSTTTATPSATPTVPGAPTAVAATMGSGQVALTWTAPVNQGGASISDYKVEYQVVGAGSWTNFAHSASTATSRTVTGLTNGTYYNFRISAINSVGTSAASTSVQAGPGTNLYYHIEGTGQSLMEGVTSAPALSTSQVFGNLSLSPSPDAGAAAPLIPLVETVNGRESPASGIANSLATYYAAHNPIIFSSNAGNGQTYAQIKKGGSNTNYATGQTQISVSQSQVAGLGGLYRPLATVVVHGEGDTLFSTSQSTYAADMAEMQNDYESDWNIATGLSQTIPLFETQVSSFSIGAIALAQLDAHINNPGKVILVGPKYQLSYYGGDHTHLQNTSSRYLGELYAKVMKKVLIDGTTWDPLMPVSVTNSGNVVTIDYHIPTGTLAIDHTNVAQRPHEGFEFYQTGGSAITINSVALDASSKKVVITLSGTPDGTNPHIRYAASCFANPNIVSISCGDKDNTDYVGGNIRDTDSSVSPASDTTNLPLYDWGVTFDQAITSATAPGAPTSLAAVPTSTQAALTWTAPDSSGGSAITDYYIEYKDESVSSWTAFSHAPATTTSATITGLTNGTNYQFRVSAVTALGTGTPSSVVTAQPSTTPGAPTSLGATGGVSQVALSWTAPASDGGAFISNYVVQYRTTTGPGSWNTFTHDASAATSITVTGLAAGTSYDFQVAAVNITGQGSFGSTATATTDITSAPSAPTGLTPTAGNTQVALSWAAPSANGSPITDYIVEYNDGSGWATFSDGTSTSTSATVTGLVNGTSYTFRVSAVNGIGTGPTSSTATATPATTAGAPTALAATRGNTQVVLSWTAPGSNGGAAITDYLVEYNSGSGWTTFADGVSSSTGATVTGLTNGTSYDFRVSAINSVGTGSASSTATATPATTPGTPTALGATPGNTQVALAWTAPGSTGGSAITDYVIEYNSGSGWTTFPDGTSTAVSATVTGLTNGTSYDFRVSTVNAVGTGSPSSTATATPVTVPGVPTTLDGTASTGQVLLTWSAPISNGGAAITDYLVEYNSGSGWTTFADGVSSSTGATVTGLTNGTSYDFRVSAINAVGTGSPTSTITRVYVIVPGAPVSLVATPGNTQVALSWGAPVSNGGAAITDYVIEFKESTSVSWSVVADGTSTATSTTVISLTNGTSYDFRVSATNSAGTGSVGGTATATPVVPVVSSGGGNRAPLMLLNPAGAVKKIPADSKTYISPIDGTTQVCQAFVADLKFSSKANDAAQVKLWQAFLNKIQKGSIPLTGYFGPMTFSASKIFQTDHADTILTPLGLTKATGYVYKSTRLTANNLIGCAQ